MEMTEVLAQAEKVRELLKSQREIQDEFKKASDLLNALGEKLEFNRRSVEIEERLYHAMVNTIAPDKLTSIYPRGLNSPNPIY